MSNAKTDHKPQELTFTHAGLKCVVRKSRMGAWCGYVEDERLAGFKKPEGTLVDGPLGDLDVHGGVTWFPWYGDEEPWCYRVGFGCSHVGDLVPGMSYRHPMDVYRDEDYARDHTCRLAEQVKCLLEAASND